VKVKKEICKNISLFEGYVTRQDREKLHGHKGAAFWFTGLSASGKSTIAHFAEKDLHLQGCSTLVLDGDNVRHGLCADLSFSPADRKENIRRIAQMVKLFVDAGMIVLCAFISPFRKDRRAIRALLDPGQFFEIYVRCPPEVCECRDRKGIYERARRGEIKEFTGISSPYEAPESPELVIDSAHEAPEESVKRVLALLDRHKIMIPPGRSASS
jgi:adenylylsulfate kinase